VFTVVNAASGVSGEAVAIDLATTQRILIDDAATNWAVGASFLGKTASTPLSLTTSAIGGNDLAALKTAAGEGESVLAGWTFATSGYTAGDPAYLAFEIGAGLSVDDLDIWRYDGSTWTAYVASDLTYNETFASFTVTGLGGYALTGVPLLTGDANLDGYVDAADYVIWYNHLGIPNPVLSQGDPDANGIVDAADYTIWYNHVGGSMGGAGAVPEPATLALLTLGTFAMLKRRRSA
jgi:hypothetical protein